MALLTRAHRDQRGFTLIEVLVTMFVLLVGLAGAAALLNGANARTATTKSREAGTALARELAESARSVSYVKLTATGVDSELQAMPGLTDAVAGGAWTINRRGVSYEVTATVCSVDDTQDGIGSHTGTDVFCSNPTVTNPADGNPDDYKRAAVTVTWDQGGKQHTVKQQTVVTNPSNALGPRITSYTRTPSDTEIVTNVSQVRFDVVTNRQAATVKYAIDGSVKFTDTPSSTASSFNWLLNGSPKVPDGTYLVTATAIDSQGLVGASRSLTVKLNRDPAAAPTGVVGGWNAARDIVELEWRPNDESDIVAYRVYRSVGGGPASLVCETGPTSTDCIDLTPPPGSPINYVVVAVDKDAGGANREGPPSDIKPAVRSTDRPNPPSAVAATRINASQVQVDWTAADVASPSYGGDAIRFYRIYRDGTALGDRLDHTGSEAERVFQDTDATGSHEYWVTTVDNNYSESVVVGPVSAP